MKDFALIFVAIALVACGGHTVPDGTDAGNDSGNDAAQPPIAQCHGYCPQPNGASCTSDCDCTNKCIGGVCADPLLPTVSCGDANTDASTCPSGESCAAWGVCEGAPCSNDSDCPVEQMCQSGVCHAMGCI